MCLKTGSGMGLYMSHDNMIIEGMPVNVLCVMICICCLVYASVIDIRTKMVPDIVWWILAPASFGVMGLIRAPAPDVMLDCLIVILIQEKVMSRAYGRADSHAFSCCMLMMAFSGIGIEGHILHMSLSLLILVLVQGIGHNIGPGGRLKVPVAYIPYISGSFIALYFFMLYSL